MSQIKLACSRERSKLEQGLFFLLVAITHTIYVVFNSRGFHDVPLLLIADARPFKAFRLTGTLGLDLMLVSIRCQTR